MVRSIIDRFIPIRRSKNKVLYTTCYMYTTYYTYNIYILNIWYRRKSTCNAKVRALPQRVASTLHTSDQPLKQPEWWIRARFRLLQVAQWRARLPMWRYWTVDGGPRPLWLIFGPRDGLRHCQVSLQLPRVVLSHSHLRHLQDETMSVRAMLSMSPTFPAPKEAKSHKFGPSESHWKYRSTAHQHRIDNEMRSKIQGVEMAWQSNVWWKKGARAVEFW